MSGVQAEVNIGLVGHVDAGKTSLVESLTGSWTDTHSEELKRGISIRLGYADVAFYKSGNNYTTEKKGKISRIVSFVDAPGHETLMMTMLSGAAIMNGAILVVAANEKCPQPQTVEHMNAVHASNIKNLIVAQNKIDLVSKEQAKKNFKEIKEFLKDYGYENSPIIPTAAHSKLNIDLLIKTIIEHIPVPKLGEKKPLRLFCARSFDINKPGTVAEKLEGGVIGGSIMQGTIKPGEKIEISPGLDESGGTIITNVKSVTSSNGKLKEAKPGGLIAIKTELDPSLTSNDALKGQVIAKPGSLPEPKNVIELEVEFLKRILSDLPKSFTVNEPVVLIIGTLPVIGAVAKIKGNVAQIKTNKKIVIEKKQKIAINKKDNARWRLVAYGVTK